MPTHALPAVWAQSGGERLAAAAGFRCVGVAEGKATVVEAFFPTYHHANHIHGMRLVHHYRNAFDFVFLVLFFFLIESEEVAHA